MSTALGKIVQTRRLTREERKGKTRQMIRASARQALARYGVGGLSIDAVSEAAGFSRGAFYVHYANKHELLLDILADSHQKELAVIRDMASNSESLDEFFDAMEKRYNQYAKEKEIWLLHSELQLHAQRDAAFGELYRTYSAETIAIVEETLNAIAKGRPEQLKLDLHLVAIGLRSISRGVIMEGFGEREAGRVLVLFTRALLGHPSPE